MDSYYKRGCCVSPVNEGATRQQRAELGKRRAERLAATIQVIQGGIGQLNQSFAAAGDPSVSWYVKAKVAPNKKVTGYSLVATNSKMPYPIDLNGKPLATGNNLTKLQNLLLGEEEKQPQKGDGEQTREEKFSEFDLEKAEEQARLEAENLEINDGLKEIVGQYDQEAICRARLNIGTLVNIFRPDREVPTKKADREKATKEIQKRAGDRNVFITSSDATAFNRLIRDHYSNLQNNTPGAACQFLSELNNLINTKQEKQRESLRSLFIFSEDLSQHLINLTSNNQGSVARSIDLASDPDIATTLDFILKGHCLDENEECVPPEALPPEQIEAAKENLKIVLSLIAKDKINDEEKALLQSKLMLTDTRKIALAGVTMSDSIILPDRGRAFLDLLKFAERKHGMAFDILELDSRLTSEGAINTLIGTAFEHWHTFTNLRDLIERVKDPKAKKNLKTAATYYFNKLANLCESLQAMKKRLGSIKTQAPAMPTEEYQKMLEFDREIMGDCSELSDMNRVMSNHVYKSLKNRKPDVMVQVGKEVGKGLRADTVLGFYDKDAAIAAAKASGLNPSRAVKKTTVGEMLARNKQYATLLHKAGVIGKGKEFDPDQEIYTFDEGLKTSSGRGTNAVVSGNASIVSIQEDIEQGSSSPWVKNVAASLGLRGKSLEDALKASRRIFKKLDTADSILRKSLPVVRVDGTRESTGNLTAKEIMSKLREQNVDGVMLQKDEVFRAASAYAEAVNKGTPDPAAIEYAKEQLSRALKKRLLEEELSKHFSSNKSSDRAGAALIVGMVGGVRNDQALQYADMNSGDQYIMDHNSIAVAPFMEAVNNPNNEVKIKRAKDSFAVSIKCKDGPTITVRFTAMTGTSSASKSIFTKGCGGSGGAIKLESYQRNKLLGFLKAQLEYLNEVLR